MLPLWSVVLLLVVAGAMLCVLVLPAYRACAFCCCTREHRMAVEAAWRSTKLTVTSRLGPARWQPVRSKADEENDELLTELKSDI